MTEHCANQIVTKKSKSSASMQEAVKIMSTRTGNIWSADKYYDTGRTHFTSESITLYGQARTVPIRKIFITNDLRSPCWGRSVRVRRQFLLLRDISQAHLALESVFSVYWLKAKSSLTTLTYTKNLGKGTEHTSLTNEVL